MLKIQALALSAMLIASSVHAAVLTQPTDRESQRALTSLRGALATMKPCAGVSPKVEPVRASGIRAAGMASAGLGDASGQLDQLARFLQLGITQSYNKTWEQGWSVLNQNITQTLNAFPGMPTGVRMALSSGLQASGSKSYQAAYEILLTCAKTVSSSPGEFAGDQSTAFRAYMRLARQSAYNKTWEYGYAILSTYLTNLRNNGGELIPTPELRVGINGTIAASGNLSYQAAYEEMHSSIQWMESVPVGPLAAWYMRMAVQAATSKSYEHGYRILYAYVDTAINSGMLQPFERLALESSRTNSGNKSFQAAWEILRDGLNAVAR